MVWILVPFGAALTGVAWPPGPWYAALSKPSWNPPNSIFGPVWTALYLLMGVAAWWIWRCKGFAAARGAFVAFFVQLVLNALWTPVFFGLHEIDAALGVIVALWLAIAITVVLFGRHDRVAALLLAPYLAWVGFATVLNAAIAELN
jgi:tryptophan-rich sensory protein